MTRRSGYIWILAGIALALLAGLLTVWLVLRVAPAAAPAAVAQPEIEVVVAARFIPGRHLLVARDVELRKMPALLVPDNAARSAEEAVGRIATIAIYPDEVLLTNQVIPPDLKSAQVGFLMDQDKVAMAFSASDLLGRSGLIKPGDHVDIFYSIETVETEDSPPRLVTFDALQNVDVAAIIRPGGQEVGEGVAEALSSDPNTIVVAMDPQDALVLKHLRDMAGIMTLVLRAPGAEQEFELVPVDMPYLVDRYELRIPVFP
jgi:Flp pilus assembly protein CpaB